MQRFFVCLEENGKGKGNYGTDAQNLAASILKEIEMHELLKSDWPAVAV